jgi:hypothetical protein
MPGRTAAATFFLPAGASQDLFAAKEAAAIQKLRSIGAFGDIYREGDRKVPGGSQFFYTGEEY